MQKVDKERVTKLDIKQVDCLFGTANGILQKLIQKEKEQSKDDELFKKIAHRKNSIEQYIYSTREKMDSKFKDYILPEEKEQLPKLMNTLYDWLYSEDENIYNLDSLNSKSKDMYKVGDPIYSRYSNWESLEENINLLEKAILEIGEKLKNEKETVNLNKDDFDKLNKLINDAINKGKETKSAFDKGERTKQPPIDPKDIKEYKNNLYINTDNVFKDAQKRVDEEKRKKEEEERKKKEEEEKKKKEEEEKKKKEEEEKKKKEEGDKKEEKKEEKKEDVEMKDATKEEKKDSNVMDVE